MKAYHTTQRTIEVPYRLHSGMRLKLTNGNSTEWYMVNAQSWCNENQEHITVASNSNTAIALHGSSGMYEKSIDETVVKRGHWGPSELQAKLEDLPYKSVARLASTKELCIFITKPIRVRKLIEVGDIISVGPNNWEVLNVSKDFKITIELVTSRGETICIHHDNGLAAKYNVEYENESSILTTEIKRPSRS